MLSCLMRKLRLIIATLLTVLTINFFIIHIAPNGSVKPVIGASQHSGYAYTALPHNDNYDESTLAKSPTPNQYRGNAAIYPRVIEQINQPYELNKPLWQHYVDTVKNYLSFNFSASLSKGDSVASLIWQSLPVSLSLGLSSTLLIYLISIPLGIKKAIHHGSRFDIWSSVLIIMACAIPAFLSAIFIIIFFAGDSYCAVCPFRAAAFNDFSDLSPFEKIRDYFGYLTLPTIAISTSGLAALTMLTKNSFLNEIQKQYVITARARGLSENQILYRHVFRNAVSLIMSDFSATFTKLFFTDVLLVEIIFSLNGLGFLGYQAILQHDFPVILAILYVLTLIGLVATTISDLIHHIINPGANVEGR